MSASRKPAAECWELSATRAQLHAGILRGSVDIERPELGLAHLGLAEAALPGCLFGVAVETHGDRPEPAAPSTWTPADVYVRGRDLVATYREPLGEPFNLQIYWRVVAGEEDAAIALDAIVSIQTPEWEAYPCVSVGSTLPSGGVTATQHGLVYGVNPEWNYAEAARPGDFALGGVETPTDGLTSRRWRFERQFMERGVIRRIHLRGGFTNSRDQAAALRLQKSLLADQPPLTA